MNTLWILIVFLLLRHSELTLPLTYIVISGTLRCSLPCFQPIIKVYLEKVFANQKYLYYLYISRSLRKFWRANEIRPIQIKRLKNSKGTGQGNQIPTITLQWSKLHPNLFTKCLIPSYNLEDLNLPGHICKKSHCKYSTNLKYFALPVCCIPVVRRRVINNYVFLTCAIHNLNKNYLRSWNQRRYWSKLLYTSEKVSL